MCTDDNFSGWESSLPEYRLQKPEVSRMDLYAELPNNITVFDQWRYMSTIPNYHKWFWKFEKMLELLTSNVLVHRVKDIRDLLETGLFRQLVFEASIISWFLL